MGACSRLVVFFTRPTPRHHQPLWGTPMHALSRTPPRYPPPPPSSPPQYMASMMSLDSFKIDAKDKSLYI